MTNNKKLFFITIFSTILIVLSKSASLIINSVSEDMIGLGETNYLLLFLGASLILLGTPAILIKLEIVNLGRILYAVLALIIYVVHMVSFYVLSPEVSAEFMLDGYLPLLFFESAILLASAVLVISTKPDEEK